MQAPPPIDFLKKREAEAVQQRWVDQRSFFWVQAFLSQASKPAVAGLDERPCVTFADNALAAFDQRFVR